MPLLEDHARFRDHVTKVSKRSLAHGCRILRKTLSPLCLRRTKALLDIPEPLVTLRKLEFSDTEKKMYRQLEDHFRTAMNASVGQRDDAAANTIMFKAILQLRIFCNQGTFYPMPSDADPETDPDEALTLLEERDEACCVRCHNEVLDVNQAGDLGSGVIMNCDHVLCAVCFGIALDDEDQEFRYCCPVCNHEVFRKSFLQTRPSMSATGLSDRGSTKLERLLEDLMEFQRRDKR